MNYFVLIIILFISFLLALWSFSKQKKSKEVDFVNRELKKKRVIYHHSSSSDESPSR